MWETPSWTWCVHPRGSADGELPPAPPSQARLRTPTTPQLSRTWHPASGATTPSWRPQVRCSPTPNPASWGHSLQPCTTPHPSKGAPQLFPWGCSAEGHRPVQNFLTQNQPSGAPSPMMGKSQGCLFWGGGRVQDGAGGPATSACTPCFGTPRTSWCLAHVGTRRLEPAPALCWRGRGAGRCRPRLQVLLVPPAPHRSPSATRGEDSGGAGIGLGLAGPGSLSPEGVTRARACLSG